MTIIERYPDEEFNTELQQEWARAVIEQLTAYASSHTVCPDVRVRGTRHNGASTDFVKNFP